MIQQNTLRRQDQSIEIGPRHGYRIECDQASINAELQVPPQHAGGDWKLELWATDHPYSEGALTGLKIAEVAVGLPTPIAPYLHQVDAQVPARLPLHGRTYSMVMALVQRGPDGQTTVGAFVNYAEPQTFIAPYFSGEVGYRMDGEEVVLAADGIFNPRIEGNSSGTLSIQLWAFPEAGSSSEGLRLAATELGCVDGQHWLPAAEHRAAFTQPPVGRHRMALLLCEWTAADGYVARDRRDLESSYERSAPAPVTAPAAAPAAATAPVTAAATAAAAVAGATAAAAATAATAPVTVAGTAAAAEKLRLIPKAVDSGLVSIQTASVEELAQVKGLNLKIAKDIVKARPFTALSELTRVRGIGEKTIDRLKDFLTV